MTPERWRQIDDVLSEALDLEQAGRAAFLDRSCNGDADLRLEVESLLECDPEAGQVIAGAVQESAASFDDSRLGLADGDRVGAYRIVREIGRGGMGTVYLAERGDDEFKKQVAIKLVTRGMDTAALLNRFRQERQILARLEHPYIARLVDGGSTADGRPYLVMEHVEGKPITAYCAERKLSTHERVELFRKVCAAVQSAHQNLVVHRDLKPGNILVDASGSPKLLDFGIAKLLGSDEAPQFTVAMGNLQLLTPDYASPEQVRGETITTAADVYALGAILYELVAGVRPHRIEQYTPAEIERSICTVDPERPSTAAPSALKAGDLDNIILMAMQKEPGRRYGSAAELSEDLRRYQDGLPVRAREDTLGYRMRKFVRRHRAGVAAALLLVASLAGGITVSMFEARRAERRFDEVRRLSHAVLYDIHDAIRDLPGSVKAREVVVKTALQYLDGLAREAGNDSGLQLELAEAYERVGDVQGNVIARSLGQTSEALASYNKGLSIADGLAAHNIEPDRANLLQVQLRERAGDILSRRGETAAALALFQKAAETGEAVLRRNPRNQDVISSLSGLYVAMARENQDNAAGVASATRALELLNRLVEVQPGSEAALADGYMMLGTLLALGNQLEKAYDAFQKVVRLREQLVRQEPNNVGSKRQEMIAYSRAADLLGPVTPSLLRPAEAAPYYRKMLAVAESLAAADPADQRAAFDHAMALMRAGYATFPESDSASAIALLKQALDIFEKLAAADLKDLRLQRQVALTRLYLSQWLTRAGDKVASARVRAETIRQGEALMARKAKDLALYRLLWRAYEDDAGALSAQGRTAEALSFAEKAIKAAQTAAAIDPKNSMTLALLPRAYAVAGSVAERAGQIFQAREWFEKSAAAWKKIPLQNGWPKDRDSELARVTALAVVSYK